MPDARPVAAIEFALTGEEGMKHCRTTDIIADAAYAIFNKPSRQFTGQFLIEPKPKEPTKHQYDHDVQTVYGFLKRFGLEKHRYVLFVGRLVPEKMVQVLRERK